MFLFSKKINRSFFAQSLFVVFAVMFFLAPAFSFAAADNVQLMINKFSAWIGALIYVVVGLALVFFVWGVLGYITSGDDEEKRRDARNFILYSIIGIFIMLAVWSLVALLAYFLGFKLGGEITVPALPGSELSGTIPVTKLSQIIAKIGSWISSASVLLIGLAALVFIWGIAKFILSAADEEKRRSAKNLIAYGIVGIFAMLAVWSLVYFVSSSLGFKVGGGISTPQIDDFKITKDITIKGEKFEACGNWFDANGKSFKNLVCLILNLLNPIPAILIALCLFYFFWGIIKYINAAGEEDELKEGRNTIIFGVIGFFVIASIWALVIFARSEFGLG